MKRYLKKHRDVATCDGCGHLLMAYGNERDFEETKKALTAQAMGFDAEPFGTLHVISKQRLKKK
jgi:ribosomal protein L34E